MHRWRSRALLFVSLLASACAGTRGPVVPISAAAAPALPLRDFAGLSVQLSEPGGVFPSDNLVSNETSYLHVLGTLDTLGVRGGAYVGVGPDQNFSYIAHVRPAIAFLIDIRRDALLQHLLYKALFERARNRAEYMCLLLARSIPAHVESWADAGVHQLVAYVDSLAADSVLFEATARDVASAIQRYGIPLSAEDLSRVRAMHAAFAAEGLDVRYATRATPRAGLRPSFSRSGQYVTVTVIKPGERRTVTLNGPSAGVNWRRLLLETNGDGERANYLANEVDFQYVKDMHRRNRIIPVVGDLAGTHALAGIGRAVAERGLRVRVFYTSNVEQYLIDGPGFTRYAETVAALPHDEKSVITRSYMRGAHAQNVAGHNSTQLVERFETFVAVQRSGDYTSYADLVTRHVVAPPVRRVPVPDPAPAPMER
jgi:hypothetical protein